MESNAHVDALVMESERFGRAARGALDVRVPSCPEWTLGDLVWHLANVQWLWSEIVRRRELDRDGIGQPEDRPDEELAPWFDEVSAGLAEALRSTDPSVRVWSWADGQQDVAWVARRQAHEVAVHRWDAQGALGAPEPIGSDLAADGIGEFFDWMLEPEDAAARLLSSSFPRIAKTRGPWRSGTDVSSGPAAGRRRMQPSAQRRLTCSCSSGDASPRMTSASKAIAPRSSGSSPSRTSANLRRTSFGQRPSSSSAA